MATVFGVSFAFRDSLLGVVFWAALGLRRVKTVVMQIHPFSRVVHTALAEVNGLEWVCALVGTTHLVPDEDV